MKVSRQDLSLKHFNTWKDENNDFLAGTPTPASFNLVLALAAERVALGKLKTVACLDVSIAFLYAEMQVEVYIKMDADTLRLIRDENLPNLQSFDDQGFHKVDKAVVRISRLTTILEGRRVRGSERSWTQTKQDREFFVHLDPGNSIQFVHVDDELLSGDDQLVRDMEPKLKQKDLGEESGLSAPGWRHD